MPATISHVLTATTPDDPLYEIKPSNWNSAHAVTLNVLATEISGLFSNKNGVSFGLDGTNITASITPAGGAQTGISGIIASDATYTSGSVYFSNQANVTIGSSVNGASQYVRLSVAPQSVQPVAVSGSNGSFTFSTATFGNLNGVSFYTSNGSLVASHNGLTSQSNQALSGSNGSFTFQTATFGNLNGVSFYTSNGSLVASHNGLTTARASNDAIGLNTAQSNVTWTVNSSGISLDARGYAGTGTTFNGANVSGSLTVNSNGVQVSLSAPVEVGAAVSLSGNSTSAGAGYSNVSTGTLILAGGNNITLSQNGASVTISGANVGGAQTGISGLIASDATYTSGSVYFSNQANVTIGTSVDGASQYIRLSVAAPGAAVEANWFTLSNVAAGASSSASGSTIGLSGQNITLSGTNNSQIVFIGPASGTAASPVSSVDVVGTNGTMFANVDHRHAGIYSMGVVNAGHSAGNTGYRVGQFAFLGNNVTLSQITGANGSNTIWFTGPATGDTAFGVTSGNVVGTNSTKYANVDHQHVGVYSLGVSTGGNTAGDTAVRPGQVVFAGGANITLSMATAAGSLQTISIVGGAGGGGLQSAGFSTQGNTSGDTGFASQSIQFVGGNNITLSGSTNAGGMTMTISGANAGGAQTGISGLQVSNTTYTSGTVTFQNANGISFGSSGANGISASYTVPTQTNQTGGIYVTAQSTGQSSSSTYDVRTLSIVPDGIISAGWSNGSFRISATQSNQNALAGNGNFNFQTISFSDVNGFSFLTAAGSAIQGSYTVPVSSNGILDVSTATAAGTATSRFAMHDHQHRGLRAMVVDGVASTFFGNYTLSAGANITLSTGGNTTAGNVVIHGPTQSNQTLGIYASSQTFGQSSSSTHDARSLTIVGSGNISVGWSAGSLLISAPTGGGGGAAISLPANGASRTSGGAGYSNISTGTAALFGNNLTLSQDGASITFSANAPGAAVENNWFHALGANTSGNTTASGSTIGLSGINLTISGTNASVLNLSVPATSSLSAVGPLTITPNGSTISFSVGGPFTGSYFANVPYYLAAATQTMTLGQSTSLVYPMDLKEYESIAFMNMPHSVSWASTSFASTANTSYSYQQNVTHNHVFYTRGTGASSMSLRSIASTSFSHQISMRISRNATNNISVTHGLTYPMSTGTSSTSFSYAATNSSDQFSTTHLTILTGIKLWDSAFETLFEPKLMWHAYGYSSTHTTQQTAALSNARMLITLPVVTQANNSVGSFGLANNVSIMWRPGNGSFTTAGGGTTASIPLSAISSTASHGFIFFQMGRIA